MSHNRQKKVAVINDISGFGRCAMTVALPIISMLKVQCCPVPTSIFSNHSGFDNFYFEDYTDRMQPYVEQWKRLDLKFDGISTGFMGSKEQIKIVLRFLEDFRMNQTVVVVDPIMGDHGKRYRTYTDVMCREMRRLVVCADILTPNLTEACLLTDTKYHETKWSRQELEQLSGQLSAMGPQKIVITGINQGDYIGNYCYEKELGGRMVRTRKVGTPRCGTGDIFSAIIVADAVNGVAFETSVRKASQFIKRCIERSVEMAIPETDGVCFEELLGTLK